MGPENFNRNISVYIRPYKAKEQWDVRHENLLMPEIELCDSILTRGEDNLHQLSSLICRLKPSFPHASEKKCR